MTTVRGVGVCVLAGALAAVLAGCTTDAPQARPEARPSTTTAAPPPAPPTPRAGSCHALSFAEATNPVDSGGTLPCRKPHTSVTFEVGPLDPLVDGHLLAVDSRTVQAQIASSCQDLPGKLLGGDRTAQRLSRFEVVWFSPSLEEADAGANWYRCDVVALASTGKLLPLPARIKGVLDEPGALDRFGTCGNKAPDRPGFARVACAQKHSWRAVDAVDLPRNARYLDKAVTSRGDATCEDVAAARAAGALKYTWSFEWPTEAQWKAGQRHGYCWVPAG